jgi:hypothetical protein
MVQEQNYLKAASECVQLDAKSNGRHTLHISKKFCVNAAIVAGAAAINYYALNSTEQMFDESKNGLTASSLTYMAILSITTLSASAMISFLNKRSHS